MEMTNVQRRPGELRRALRDGRTVDLTFHNKPIAAVVPTELLNQLLELAGDEGRRLLDDTRDKAVA